jgi:glycine cleavage system H protein
MSAVGRSLHRSSKHRSSGRVGRRQRPVDPGHEAVRISAAEHSGPAANSPECNSHGEVRTLTSYDFPNDCRYTKEDEWVRQDDDYIVLGITDYAQQELGDIVFLEMPEVGSEISAGEPFGVIESVKAVSELYAPLSGIVVEANSTLLETPELVNESCYEDGWILRIEPTDADEYDSLMDANEYREYVDERLE